VGQFEIRSPTDFSLPLEFDKLAGQQTDPAIHGLTVRVHGSYYWLFDRDE